METFGYPDAAYAFTGGPCRGYTTAQHRCRVLRSRQRPAASVMSTASGAADSSAARYLCCHFHGNLHAADAEDCARTPCKSQSMAILDARWQRWGLPASLCHRAARFNSSKPRLAFDVVSCNTHQGMVTTHGAC